MIVVLGRPFVADSPAGHRPAGLAARIALAAAAAGGRVELAGSVGDDEAADAVAIGLARAGVGHAALQRIPAAGAPGAAPGPSAGRGGRSAAGLDAGTPPAEAFAAATRSAGWEPAG